MDGRVLYTLGLGALVLPCGLANLAVLVSSGLVLGRGAEPRTAYMLLGSVALADLATAWTLLAGLVFPHAVRTPLLCAFLIGSEVSCSLISMISILLIGVERFLYIVEGIKYDYILTPNRMRLLILLSWVAGFSCGLLPQLLTMGQYSHAEFRCRFVDSNRTVIILAAAVAIPALVVTIVLYTIVFVHVRKITRDIAGPQGNRKMKLKSILVVFLSSVCFLFTWGPYLIVGFTYALSCHSESLVCKNLAYALASPLAILGFVNSILNPIIYAWWHRPFNKAIRKIVCPKRMREKKRRDECDVSIETVTEGCVL